MMTCPNCKREFINKRKNFSIDYVMRLRSKGLSYRSIARLLGCCHQTVKNRLVNYQKAEYGKIRRYLDEKEA